MSIPLLQETSLTINGRPITQFSDGSIIDLAYNGDTGTLKTAYDGSSIYAPNIQGYMATLTFRLNRASADDIDMNNLMSTVAGGRRDAGNFVDAVVVKSFRTADSQNIIKEKYICSGGVFMNKIGSTTNVEGDTESLSTPYVINFTNVERIMT